AGDGVGRGRRSPSQWSPLTGSPRRHEANFFDGASDGSLGIERNDRANSRHFEFSGGNRQKERAAIPYRHSQSILILMRFELLPMQGLASGPTRRNGHEEERVAGKPVSF